MKRESTKASGETLSPDRVLGYLADNPDFLNRHPDLLRNMTPPDRELGAGIADLQKAMIGGLQDRLANLEGRQRELMSAARANLKTQHRVHECVLALLDAKSFEQLVQTVTTDFAVLLDLDIVTLGIETEEGEALTLRRRGLHVLPPGTVEAIIGRNHAVALHSNVAGDPAVFGNGVGLVRSAAYVRLDISEATPPALLAFGSRAPGFFDESQGTELLRFLAQVLEHVVRLWLDLPQ